MKSGGRTTKKAATKKPTKSSYVKSRIDQPELKAVDAFLGSSILSGVGAANHVALINNPIQGPDRNQRIGRKIQIKSIHCRFSLHPVTPVPTSVPEDIVILLVWGYEGGPLPALADVLQDVNYAGTTLTNVRSNTNLDTTKRFKILRRKNIPLRICGTATGALPCNGAAFQANQDDINWEWYMKCDLMTQFNSGNAGTVADIENGSLFILFYTDLGPALPVSSIDITTRIRYYD